MIFFKKSWPNYAVLVVQIMPTSNEIGKILYCEFAVAKYVFMSKPRVIYTYIMVYYFPSHWTFLFRWAVLVPASQKQPVLTLKMENVFFIQQKP